MTTIDKTNARITGVFYIIAAVSSMIGLALYNPLLNSSDYLTLGATNSNQIVLGAFFELILVCTVAGTGIMLFPYLRKCNESMALAYFVFRLLEAVFIVIGIVSVLALLTLSKAYINTTGRDIAAFHAGGIILKAIHDWTFMLGPNFMLGINTFLYSYIFYNTELVSKRIASMGMVAAGLIFCAALLEMFGIILQLSLWGALLGIPIFIYEMTLAIWLIRKGFNIAAYEGGAS